MRNSRSILIVLLVAVVVLASGCSPFASRRQPKVPGSVAPAPPVSPPKAPRQLPDAEPPTPRPITEPPPDPMVGMKPSVGSTPPPLVEEATSVGAPPPSETRPPKRETVSEPGPRKSEAAPPAQAPVNVPQLTQLLTKDEEWAYNREVDEILVSVSETDKLLGRRALSEEQMIELDRIRAFLKQTIEVRQTDLVTARNLARRARLFANDLERSSR